MRLVEPALHFGGNNGNNGDDDEQIHSGNGNNSSRVREETEDMKDEVEEYTLRLGDLIYIPRGTAFTLTPIGEAHQVCLSTERSEAK